MADVPVLYRIFVLPCKRCKTSSRARKLFIHSFYSYSVPAVHRRDRYAGMVQLQHQLPKRALPHLVIRTSFHHFAVTSNLLHWTVWLLSTTIYIGVKGVLCLFFESISGSLATAPDSHPVSLYLQSPPSVPLRLCALYSNSEIAQGDASVP